MKLPNGYGTVYKLSGNRRKPWIARTTKAWSPDGKQIYNIIGYYETRTDALQALAEYNDNPYDLDISRETFSDIYKRWLDDTFDENTNKFTLKNYIKSYNHTKPLQNMRMADIRPNHLQEILDDPNITHTTASRIKLLFSRIYKWCIEHDAIKKNYADRLKIKQTPTHNERSAFTTEEIQYLWDNVNNYEYIKLVLMLIYSGVRISELLNLKTEDVHLDEQWFLIRDAKTEAGTMRVVPIADKVLPFWKEFIKKSKCSFAITTIDGYQLYYDNFKRNYWGNLMKSLQLKHTTHETRHTFISLMVSKNINQTIIKKIVGHKSIMNLTEKVYTHIETQELLNAVNKI